MVALAHERFSIDRLLLSQSPPDQRRVVPPRTLQILITWIAKRYKRQAFPDEFDLLARKAKGKVDKFLTRHVDKIAMVFVHLADREGQTPRFELAFRVLIKRNALAEDWPTQRAGLEQEFEACWEGADGLQVEALVVQDRQFSIGEMLDGDFKTFDRDWISYAVDPEGEAAPEF
jgi:hypothetical protein